MSERRFSYTQVTIRAKAEIAQLRDEAAFHGTDVLREKRHQAEGILRFWLAVVGDFCKPADEVDLRKAVMDINFDAIV